MSDHYYSSQPSSQSEDREVQAQLLGHSFKFHTDAGIFSKRGIDFGSRFLIEAVEIKDDSSILDLGCGYGPIGIAIAKAYPTVSVKMVDVNERAVQLAQENVRRSGVSLRAECIVSDGFTAIASQKFDEILFNPPIRVGKSLVYQLFADAKSYLLPNGSLWVVIRKQQGAASALAELRRFYPRAQIIEQKKGYCIIRAISD